MACFKCKQEFEVERQHKKKETWKCKLGIHELDHSLCMHEENYRVCKKCGRFIEIPIDY